jgi:hypothetical protein
MGSPFLLGEKMAFGGYERSISENPGCIVISVTDGRFVDAR